MKQALDLIKFSDWYPLYVADYLLRGFFFYNFLRQLNPSNYLLQTIESSAREFVGKGKSTTLAASVVQISYLFDYFP